MCDFWEFRMQAIRARDLDIASLKPHQIVNHFSGAKCLTTKVGLLHTLRNLPWFTSMHPDRCVSRPMTREAACTAATHDPLYPRNPQTSIVPWCYVQVRQEPNRRIPPSASVAQRALGFVACVSS